MNIEPQPSREQIESLFAQLDAVTAQRDELIKQRDTLEKQIFGALTQELDKTFKPFEPDSKSES